MSAELAVRAAMLAALAEDAALGALLNGVYDGAPVKASPPYAVVGECLGSDWGTKDADGRELRMTLSLFDAQETPARLAAAMRLADGVVRGMSGVVDGAWRIGTVALLRSRTVKGRDRGWSCVMDYRVRVLGE
ncbi:MAG: tail completion protein gp17 [Sphingobium phenoxybenzoativorans]